MSDRFWLVTGWFLTAAAVAGLWARWSVGTSQVAVVGAALSPLLVAAVAVVAVSAWRTASAHLRLAALGAGVAYLATFAPAKSLVGCGAEASDNALVIYSHNVRYLHGRPATVAGQATGAGADLIILQEVWPEFVAELMAVPAMAEYPYRAGEPDDGAEGLAIWSRWPLSGAALERAGTEPVLQVEVASPHGPVKVATVHTTAPYTSDRVEAWAHDLEALATFPTAAPAVLAGDFNATADHHQFRAVLDQGWTDVHDPKGCGFDATWPAGRALPVSVLQLDHVLVTDHFEVLAVDVGPAAGSDHRSVIATIGIADPGAGGVARAPGPG